MPNPSITFPTIDFTLPDGEDEYLKVWPPFGGGTIYGYGGDGNDTALYTSSSSGVTVNLRSGDDTPIDLGKYDSITLRDVDIRELDVDDFLFV